MASSSYTIKCKTASGSITLDQLTSNSTVEELKICLFKITNVKPRCMKLLFGYPPRPLTSDCDTMKLHEANIFTGDTLILEVMKDTALFRDVEILEEVFPKAKIPKVEKLKEEKSKYVPKPNIVTIPDEEIPKEQGIQYVQAYSANISKLDAFPELANGLESLKLGSSESVSEIMMRHEVPSNNSCLFNSIYFIISGGMRNDRKCQVLREVVAAAVYRLPEVYPDSHLGMTRKKYCDNIRNPNVWGGGIELSVLSNYFELEIIAIDTQNVRPHHFGQDRNYEKCIFMIYDGIHYDPLVLEYPDGKMQTIFLTKNERYLNLAIEVAQEAHSSRQFVDMAHFTLSCQDCGLRMRGEREAREHASTTGHVRFGEIKENLSVV